MYCSKCGVQIQDDTKFCFNCGEAISQQGIERNADVSDDDYANSKIIGFSSKINDPAFSKYQNDSKRWSYIFSLILAVIALIAFPIYGSVSGEIEMPYSLYYGLGIGGMFVAIAAMQAISRSTDTTWDGIVVDKKSFTKQRHDKYSDRYIKYTVFEYYVKRDNGKVYYNRSEDDDTVYNYYNIGDKVRHHKGFGGYEKYDKSKDTFLFCSACGSINEISDDVCSRCNCPLLK